MAADIAPSRQPIGELESGKQSATLSAACSMLPLLGCLLVQLPFCLLHQYTFCSSYPSPKFWKANRSNLYNVATFASDLEAWQTRREVGLLQYYA